MLDGSCLVAATARFAELEVIASILIGGRDVTRMASIIRAMSTPISRLDQLLASMRPVLNKGVYAFASAPLDADLGELAVISTFREREGVTIIALEHEVQRTNLPILFRATNSTCQNRIHT